MLSVAIKFFNYYLDIFPPNPIMSQAPESMKSVLQACWLLTVAFGNIIVIIVAEAKAFNQAGEFFMFAILMILDMIVFAWLAYR